MADSGASRLPAEKRKSQLLDTAARIFAARGYTGATTAELAKAAGITEPIIYRHFKGKKELFIALVERTGQQTIRDWEESLRGINDPAARLARLISANPMVLMRGRVSYRVIAQAMMEVEDPGIREAIIAHVQKLHAFIMKEVDAAQDSGQVSKRFSPEITAWALIHLALGYGILNGLKIPGHATDRAGGHIVDVIGTLMLADRYKRPTE
ncbi:MAG: TetR/AcrR family transcriptional regulator [Phycisphaerales bacterium]